MSSFHGICNVNRIVRLANISNPIQNRFFFSKFWGGSRFSAREALEISKKLFQGCKVIAKNEMWGKDMQIKSDFRSKHGLILMHVWLIHKRLLKEGSDGKMLQEALFDALWDDTSSRLREQDVPEISHNKYLLQVQGYSLRHCTNLDSIFNKVKGNQDSDLVIRTEVADLLNYYFWQDDPVMQRTKALDLSDYFIKEHDRLLLLPRESVMTGSATIWSDDGSAGIKSNKDGVAGTGGEGEWKEALAPDGRIYYWNTKSRATSWRKPRK